MKNAKLAKLFSALIILVSFFSFIPKVNAQSNLGLIVNEFVFFIDNVNPGDTITKKFTVTHDFREQANGNFPIVNITPRSENFTQDTEPGRAKFIEAESLPQEARISEWISFTEPTFSLTKQGERKEIEFTIKVPENAEPGGKYGAVVLGNDRGEKGTDTIKDSNSQGFGLANELGVLIFLTVNGDIKKDLSLEDVYTSNVWDERTNFFFNPPVNLVLNFKNNGNVHSTPKGVVHVHTSSDLAKNPESILASFDLNAKKSIILPGTSRNISVTWNESFITTLKTQKDLEPPTYSTNYDWDKLSKFRIGKYFVTVQYKIDSDESTIETTTKTLDIFIFPWQLILLIVVILLLVMLILLRKVLKHKGQKA